MDRKAFVELVAAERAANPDADDADKTQTVVDGITQGGRFQVVVDSNNRSGTYIVYLADTDPTNATLQRANIELGGEGHGPRNEERARFWTELSIGAIGAEGAGLICIPGTDNTPSAMPRYIVHKPGDHDAKLINLEIEDPVRWSIWDKAFRSLKLPDLAIWPSQQAPPTTNNPYV